MGWFNLALLGVVWSWLAQRTPLPRWLPAMSLALLLAPTFVLGMAPLGVTAGMFVFGVLANVGAAALLGVHLVHLWQRRAWFPALAWLAFGSAGRHHRDGLCPGVARLLGVGSGRPTADLLSARPAAGLDQHDARHPAGAALPGAGGLRLRRTVHLLWGVGVGLMLVALLGLGFVGLLPLRPVFWLWLAAWASVPVALAAVLLLFSRVRCVASRTRAGVRRSEVRWLTSDF